LNSIEPPRYGSVCQVVWEGRCREASPYPDHGRKADLKGSPREGPQSAPLRRGAPGKRERIRLSEKESAMFEIGPRRPRLGIGDQSADEPDGRSTVLLRRDVKL